MLVSTTTTFVRDRFTWLAYLMLAFYAYVISALGPLVPFIRDELHLNYTVTGLHLSAFALGMVLAGILADSAASRWGRYAVFWGGGAGMAISMVLLSLGSNAIITILSTFMMGVLGSFMLVMINAMLSDHHGTQRAISLTEANIAASVFAALAPLFVGLGESTGIGWRIALFIGIAFWILLYGTMREVPVPATQKRHNTASAAGTTNIPLPKAYWAYWLVIFISVAVEWCMIFWAADFLENVVGLKKDLASSLVSVFLIAMIIGRIMGSRLTRSISTARLLPMAVSAVAIGFPFFWLGQVPAVNIIGLFIAGLGVANLFPLTLAAATNIASDQPDKASARISLASGSAILIAPQILGTAADQIGIEKAYGIIIIMILGIIGAVIMANRLSSQPE